MRPLPMLYSDTDRYDDVHNAYMLGDSLYVGAFDMHLKLPEGEWVDYFTGKTYQGEVDYEVADGYAGALLVKKGSVFATMKPQQYILEKEHDFVIRVYTGGDGVFTLYEDDGFTYDYEKGGYATTRFTWTEQDAGGTLGVYRRQGGFDGRPNNGHDRINNSIPKIDDIKPVRDMTVRLYGKTPMAIRLGKDEIPFTVCNGYAEFTVAATAHESDDLFYEVEY